GGGCKEKEEPGSAGGPGGAGGSPADRRIIVKDVGLATPESILYDAAADLYLVSNINGGPAEVDDNGFISRVTPDGKVAALKWIDGAKPDVKLHAPKGKASSRDHPWGRGSTVVAQWA